MLWMLRTLVIVTAIAAPAVAFGGEKVVRLDVEGRVKPVTTYAGSGRDLVERAGIVPGSRDKVSPAGSLGPGDVVKVRRAKPVELWLDGRPRQVWVHGLTVAEALGELGMTPGAEDFVAPHPSTTVLDGMPVILRNAVHAKVIVDGRTRDVVTSAPSVGELLAQAKIRLGPRDRVVPAVGTPPTQDMKIRVVRVRRVVEEKRVEIPFSHQERKDSGLEKGLRRVAQRGAEGIRAVRYVTILENGKRVSRQKLDERLVRKPRNEIVRIGTGQPAFRGGGHSDQGLASWFRASGLTAAHRSLPFGTVVRVTNLANGRSVNVVVRDRGPFVDGRVIDLSNTAFAEIAPLGSGTARVRIEW